LRPRRIWKCGNSLVITIEHRVARQLKLAPGDLVAASFTPVEAAMRPTDQFQQALDRCIAATRDALEPLSRHHE
jgi:antitoxin component of MazEF toxin-antitoxin module